MPTESPISTVPYDVLGEIFTHCLPQHKYDFNRKIGPATAAPMLLCQVCSSWRTIALSSSRLWIELFYNLTVIEAKDQAGTLIGWIFLNKQIEFIRWWKANQGQHPPKITLYADIKTTRGFVVEDLARGGLNFVLEYLSTAQYLDTDLFFWARIREKIQKGQHFAIPNMQTLVRGASHDDFDVLEDTYLEMAKLFHETQSLIGDVPNRPPSLLRRLSVDGYGDGFYDSPHFPAHWSTLTHISFSKIILSYNFWCTFIRSVPYLQEGTFYLQSIYGDTDTDPPPQYTHRYLAILDIEIYNEYDELTLLFANVDLPTLRTLSLGSRTPSWRDARILNVLRDILKSSPAIVTLSLQWTLPPDLPAFTEAPSSLSLIPIWMHTPQLECVELGMFAYARHRTEDPILDFFLGDAGGARWLDFRNPACPIRSVVVVVEGHFRERDSIPSRALELSEKYPGVDFKFSG
ncbi:hypothetical protein BDN70DRAFT_879017 [Pholiota conissans]|uniref:F-box domain-containing protein n=1 Tax=Pholiota conissans TaxID=109636 RepID=A0A9P6CTD8_9AGAR|nr:hypothetical protein BDN70DRAFT_879017 [Pholiota conissans]